MRVEGRTTAVNAEWLIQVGRAQSSTVDIVDADGYTIVTLTNINPGVAEEIAQHIVAIHNQQLP